MIAGTLSRYFAMRFVASVVGSFLGVIALAAMIDYVGAEKPARVVMVTECSMSDNVAVDHPDIEFIRPCNLCPHMKRITLPKIRRALETLTHEVTIEPEAAIGARRAIERMLAV